MQCSVTFVIFVLFWATTVDSGVKSQSLYVHPSGSSVSRAPNLHLLGSQDSYFILTS